MAKAPNMKIGIGADTSDFEKGAKQVKQGLKDLSKTGEQSLSALGDAFGVNTGKVGQMTSAIRGLGQKMTEASNTGVQAFGRLLASISPLGGAIAGLGIGAAIAGFKQLKAEAENFKSTVDGMNLSMATSAYISTYQQVLHDVNSDTGKAVAEAMSNWEKGFKSFTARLGTFATTTMADNKWDALLPSGIVRNWRQVADQAERAEAAATRNAERGAEMAELMKYQLDVNRQVAKYDSEIAEYRREAADKTKTAEERAQAEANLRDKINEKYDLQRRLLEEMRVVQYRMTQEAGSSYEDLQKVSELSSRINELEAERQRDLQKSDRLESSIANSASAAAAATQKQREEMQKMAEVQAKWAGLGTVSTAGLSSLQGGVVAPTMNIIPRIENAEIFKETLTAQLGDITIGIGLKADTQNIQDISNEVESLVSSSITRTSELIGNLVGTLAGGGDAWGDFKNAALSAFGDMAIAVGKIAIAAGLASEGIQAALHMDNPYIAIAAGAALIALGSAVKSSLSAVASGDYSASGGGYSASYGGGSSSGGYETREVTVNVTGTLEADGDKLITVLNNTNRKNYYTR